MTDMLTKYTEAYPKPNQIAETLANKMFKGWLKDKGPLLEMHTDQGFNFSCQLMKGVFEIYWYSGQEKQNLCLRWEA